MTNNELNIILSLRDQASRQLETVKKSVEKFNDSLEKVGRQMSQLGRNMAFLGAAITGPLALAFKTAANYSFQAYDSFERLENSAKRFQITIGTALTPVMEKVSYLLEGLIKWLESLSPPMRDLILQTALISGIFLTLGGMLTNVAGKIVILTSAIIGFAATHPTLMAIVGALILMIMYWDKLKAVAVPVLNTLEIGINMVAIGFHKIVAALSGFLSSVSEGLSKVYDMLSKLPGPQKEIFEALESSASETARFFKEISDASGLIVSDLENNIAQIAGTAGGQLTNFVDEGINIIQKLWDFLSNPPQTQLDTALQTFTNTFMTAYQQSVDIGQQSANILISQINSFSSHFGNAMAKMALEGGKFKDFMSQAFRQMAADFIAQVTVMIVKWMAFMALKSVGKFFGIFHQGGVAMHRSGPVYAHHGLATDEVPVIAQTGEGILSRRGMANLGGAPRLNALNSGQTALKTIDSNINIYLTAVINNHADVMSIAEDLGFAVERELRYARGI